ncbi:hypothetical protein MTsDn1_06400 [Alteromonas sp. MTD1]|uniref:hypothetical protein n=1 Tax=Alteromonas sp. MTD1 TaxID=3057962 RepID=UPI0036F34E4E
MSRTITHNLPFILPKRFVIGLFCFFTASFPGVACELHAGMEGMGFGFQHPLMQQHLAPKRDAVIGLRIDRKRTMQQNESLDIPLRFTVPPSYEQINVDVTTSDGLALLSQERFKINSTMGKENISFKALSQGTHELTLKVYALKSNVPVTYTRKVKVIVS